MHCWVGVTLYPSPLQACMPTQWLGLESHHKAIKSVFAESQRLSAPPLGLRRTPWSQGLGAYVTPPARRPAYSSARCRLPSGRSDPKLRGAVFGGPRSPCLAARRTAPVGPEDYATRAPRSKAPQGIAGQPLPVLAPFWQCSKSAQTWRKRAIANMARLKARRTTLLPALHRL
jgi:hypothetical protein